MGVASIADLPTDNVGVSAWSILLYWGFDRWACCRPAYRQRASGVYGRESSSSTSWTQQRMDAARLSKSLGPTAYRPRCGGHYSSFRANDCLHSFSSSTTTVQKLVEVSSMPKTKASPQGCLHSCSSMQRLFSILVSACCKALQALLCIV